MSNKNEFGTSVIECGRSCGVAFQAGKGFIRKYLVENVESGDADIVKVFAQKLNDLPDDPTGMLVRFKDTDFVFAG